VSARDKLEWVMPSFFGYTPVSDAVLPSYSCDGDVVFVKLL